MNVIKTFFDGKRKLSKVIRGLILVLPNHCDLSVIHVTPKTVLTLREL